jgi:hypothetical protein
MTRVLVDNVLAVERGERPLNPVRKDEELLEPPLA